ncbi:uncharacterized protein LOC122267872 [Penaeus japonicus]|uniref:uncharacterized protein LOC122267872 n=1 Tax=Penaeus japonicus TaxID=27405 RepID=UPI001C713D22|nr:uncharacterized protein LOC122267872 [Penaeus japonicus]
MAYEEAVAAAFALGLAVAVITKAIRKVNYRLESAWASSHLALRKKLRNMTCVWLWRRPKCMLLVLPLGCVAVAANTPSIKNLVLYKGVQLSSVLRYMKLNLILKLVCIALAGSLIGDVILSGVLKQLVIIAGLSPYIVLKRIVI